MVLFGFIHNCQCCSANEASTACMSVEVYQWRFCPCGDGGSGGNNNTNNSSLCAYFNFINFNFLQHKHAHEILSTVSFFLSLSSFFFIRLLLMFAAPVFVCVPVDFFSHLFTFYWFRSRVQRYQFVFTRSPHEHLFDFHEMKWAYIHTLDSAGARSLSHTLQNVIDGCSSCRCFWIFHMDFFIKNVLILNRLFSCYSARCRVLPMCLHLIAVFFHVFIHFCYFFCVCAVVWLNHTFFPPNLQW